MKTVVSRFSAKLACGLSIASVAIAATFGVPSVRADSEISVASLHELVVVPMMGAVHAVQSRLAGLEDSVAQFAGSFASRQITAQELCVADQGGAQTCITKAQLDALLGVMMRAAAPAAAAEAEMATALVEPVVAEPATVVAADSVTKVVEAEVAEIPAVAADDMAATGIAASELPPVAPAVEAEAAAETPAIEAETVVSAEQTTIAKEVESTETTVIESTVIESTPSQTSAETPVEALEQERRSEETTTTGSIMPENSGLAQVSHPDVEISIAVDANGVEE
jgi:hypothetical protein